jgi:hypothetical protein
MKPLMGSHGIDWVVFTVVGVFVAGCYGNDSAGDRDPPVPVVSAQNESAQTAGAGLAAAGSGEKVLNTGPFEKKFDGIRFAVPAGWKEVELAPAQQGFIDARFLIPTPDGEVSLTFSSNRGGVQSNVERWIGQFQTPPDEKPTVEEFEVSGKPATWVDVHGEFQGGPMSARPTSGPGSGTGTGGGRGNGRGRGGGGGGGQRSGTAVERMLGVGIPLGSQDFYLKLTGTKAAVGNVRDAFREFVRGARVTP